jgi:hypothetical protein
MSGYKSVFNTALPVDQKLVKANRIHGKMSIDTLFDNPPVPFDDFLAQISTQRVAAQNAIKGGELETEILRNATLDIQVTIRKYQLFVDQVANGSREIILRSGFDVSKDPAPVGEMPKSHILWVKNADLTGAVKVRVRNIRGKKYLEVQLRPLDSDREFTNWQNSSSSIFVLKGLESLRRYVIRVRAVGAKGPGSWSDEVQFSAL